MSKVLIPLINRSLAVEGYQELESGLIIQWGTFTATVNSGAGTTNTPMYQGAGGDTFPVAFKEAVYRLALTPHDNPNIVLEYANRSGVTLTNFSSVLGGIQNQGEVPASTSLVVDWIAIGK